MKKIAYVLGLLLYCLPVYASENYMVARDCKQLDLKDLENVTCEVYVKQEPANYVVQVPFENEIEVNKKGTAYNNFDITVKGNIASDKIVYVVPGDEISLIAAGRKPIRASLLQEKEKFKTEDIRGRSTSAGCLLYCEDLGIGKWVSNITYEIYVKDK